MLRWPRDTLNSRRPASAHSASKACSGNWSKRFSATYASAAKGCGVDLFGGFRVAPHVHNRTAGRFQPQGLRQCDRPQSGYRRQPAGPPWIADVKRHNDIGVIDGVPMAYKDIDSVVATQRELVEVVCAVIALHAALQGFMALTLDRGNGFLVMSKKDAAAWLSEHQQGRSSKQCRPWIVS